MEKILLWTQIVSTLPLCAIIWAIQLVRYPRFASVDAESFRQFHSSHTFWITPVVAPPMILELVSSVALIFYQPAGIDEKLLYFGLLLTITAWVSTALIQVPLHDKLALGFDAETHRYLVNSNWIRTIAWTLRAGLVVHFIRQAE